MTEITCQASSRAVEPGFSLWCLYFLGCFLNLPMDKNHPECLLKNVFSDPSPDLQNTLLLNPKLGVEPSNCFNKPTR